MPLQSSGAISLQDIEDEFGGTGAISMSEYYRGGANVPDTDANDGIPTSGAISFSDFYGGDATSEVVTISGESITALAIDPDNATASLRIDNDGNVYRVVNGVTTQLDSGTDWIRPTSAAPGAYHVRYVNLTGDALSSDTKAEGVWHELVDGDFTLTLSRTILGELESTFTIQFRQGPGGSLIDAASYTLTARVDTE